MQKYYRVAGGSHKRTQSGPPTEGRLRDYDAALTAVIQRNGGV
jgi:hypothetical protein